MVDCPELGNLRDASFKGVPFYVDKDEEGYARRIVTHEFPNREDPLHEDLGERYQTFKVNAYVTGSGSEAKKDALTAVCRSYGPGLLVLPAMAPILARCMSCVVSRSKDQQGHFIITMEFRAEVNTSFAGIFLAGAFEALIGSSASELMAGMQVLASSALRVTDVLQFTVDNHVNRVRLFASDAADYTEQAIISDNAVGASLVHQATALYANAEALSRDPATLVEATFNVMQNLANAGAPADVIVSLRRLCEFSAIQPDPISKTSGVVIASDGSYIPAFTPQPAAGSIVQDLANAELFNGLVRKFALAFYALTLSRITFATRSEAITARAEIVEWFNREIDSVQDDETTYLQLTTLRDHIVSYINGSVINTIPVLEISVPASMPALYWAHRLYADAERADEIVARNGMIDPGFTPTTFEALAR